MSSLSLMFSSRLFICLLLFPVIGPMFVIGRELTMQIADIFDIMTIFLKKILVTSQSLRFYSDGGAIADLLHYREIFSVTTVKGTTMNFISF